MSSFCVELILNIAKNNNLVYNFCMTNEITKKEGTFIAEDYIQRRAKNASQKKFMTALKQVPDVSLDENDKI